MNSRKESCLIIIIIIIIGISFSAWQNTEIVNAVEDLLVTNEIYTRITGVSKYREGIKKLSVLWSNSYGKI